MTPRLFDLSGRMLLVAALFTVASCGGGGGGTSPAATGAAAGAAPAVPPGTNPPPAPAPAEPAPAPAEPAPAPAPAAPPRAVTLQSGLDHPWGLAFLPDGSMLVTERPGRLRLVGAGGQPMSDPIAGLPAIRASDQGGLLDIEVDPAFATNRTVYFTYVEGDADANGLAVARARLSDDARALEQLNVLFRQSPKKAGGQHYGGRIAVAADGTLFVTLGERFNFRNEAQNPANTLGKVVRITTDGAPAGSPAFATAASAAPGLWSIGHRNPQGAAIHPQTGELWISEHGPQGGDEINIVSGGGNYGWDRVSYGCEYGDPIGNACRIGGGTHAPNYSEPVATWTPTSTAPSGLTFVTADRFPEWKGSLLVGALAGQAVWRLQFDGTDLVAREALFTDLGERIRDVREGPDGWIYLLTDASNGRLMRIER